MDGKLVIGMNRHREICTMQLSGNILILKDQIKRCVNIAGTKVTQLTEYIQNEITKTNPSIESNKSERKAIQNEKMMIF
jgi:exosome complex RNA-binding protein Rrp42 (RNase PH superfamily)